MRLEGDVIDMGGQSLCADAWCFTRGVFFLYFLLCPVIAVRTGGCRGFVGCALGWGR